MGYNVFVVLFYSLCLVFGLLLFVRMKGGVRHAVEQSRQAPFRCGVDLLFCFCISYGLLWWGTRVYISLRHFSPPKEEVRTNHQSTQQSWLEGVHEQRLPWQSQS